jgi:voltage-gated potassium channel
MATFAVTLLFFIATGSVMWRDIFSGAATTNRICGAVCLYLLIGFCFAMVHMIVALQNPNAYKDTLRPPQHNVGIHRHYPFFVYFSFCTLTTVGYGDVSPASRLSRTLAWVEALTGQLYLAILVARLVGMHIVTAKTSKS